MTVPPPKAWLDQSRADLNAARSRTPDMAECHRRYLYQQAYEKAIKAYVVPTVRKEDDAVQLVLRDTFLGSHTPLSSFAEDETPASFKKRLARKYGNDWQRGHRVLLLVRRRAEALVRTLAGAAVIKAIDATQPNKDARQPSYRYPFQPDANQRP